MTGRQPLLYGANQQPVAWTGTSTENALRQIAVEAFGHLIGLEPREHGLVNPEHIAQAIGRMLREELQARYPKLQLVVRGAQPGEAVPE
jgi:hypothetical protein